MAKSKLAEHSYDRSTVDRQPIDENEPIAKQAIQDSILTKEKLLNTSLEAIVRASTLVANCLIEGKKLIVFGNGGSAADAQHLAAELVGRFNGDRPPFKAMALTTNSSTITAIGNDYGFEEIYSRQIRAHTEKGDAVIAISTSGRSRNILKGVEMARACGATTIGLTGSTGGELKDFCDCAVLVPSEDVQRIQECHALIIHIICQIVERTIRLK